MALAGLVERKDCAKARRPISGVGSGALGCVVALMAFEASPVMTIVSQSGLSLTPSDLKTAGAAVAFYVCAVTIFVWALDCIIFRDHLPATYVAFYTSPLLPRTLVVCLLAIFEEVKYRLLLMTVLMLIVTALFRRTPPVWCVALIIVATQAVNVGGLFFGDSLYVSLRYLAVGSVWGWLYWRHGWLSAATGHGTVHILLDPLLLIGLE